MAHQGSQSLRHANTLPLSSRSIACRRKWKWKARAYFSSRYLLKLKPSHMTITEYIFSLRRSTRRQRSKQERQQQQHTGLKSRLKSKSNFILSGSSTATASYWLRRNPPKTRQTESSAAAKSQKTDKGTALAERRRGHAEASDSEAPDPLGLQVAIEPSDILSRELTSSLASSAFRIQKLRKEKNHPNIVLLANQIITTTRQLGHAFKHPPPVLVTIDLTSEDEIRPWIRIADLLTEAVRAVLASSQPSSNISGAMAYEISAMLDDILQSLYPFDVRDRSSMSLPTLYDPPKRRSPLSSTFVLRFLENLPRTSTLERPLFESTVHVVISHVCAVLSILSLGYVRRKVPDYWGSEAAEACNIILDNLYCDETEARGKGPSDVQYEVAKTTAPQVIQLLEHAVERLERASQELTPRASRARVSQPTGSLTRPSGRAAGSRRATTSEAAGPGKTAAARRRAATTSTVAQPPRCAAAKISKPVPKKPTLDRLTRDKLERTLLLCLFGPEPRTSSRDGGTTDDEDDAFDDEWFRAAPEVTVIVDESVNQDGSMPKQRTRGKTIARMRADLERKERMAEYQKRTGWFVEQVERLVGWQALRREIAKDEQNT